MDKETLRQLVQWHEEDQFQQIVDVILAVPEEERDYDLTGQLARALNNLGDYETAVEVLLSVEEEGRGDPLWHYRLGYAYYYSNNFGLARAEFGIVLELTPDDQDARMFIEWCEEEMSPTVVTDKLNRRLMAAEAIQVGVSFRQRADAFWAWFTENEPVLSEMLVQGPEEERGKIVEFVLEGVRLIGEQVHFDIGGDYEFSFAVEGNNYLFYLLPWLVARMPRQFRSKWHFSPYLTGTKGQSFGFRMYDVDLLLEDVMVGLQYDEEQNYFNVCFYHEQLGGLPEEECYHAFYKMMEVSIGEGLARIYINDVKKAEVQKSGMFPLTKLEDCMAVALEEAGKEIILRPDERYTVYSMDFDEVRDLRYDMMIGNTCFTELVQEYFSGETTYVDALEVCGAKAVFLVIPVGEMERSELLNLRYEIEDRLVSEVLGERGSGQETGILLGGATAQDCLYIDILLYDIQDFMAVSGDFLMQYPYPFYLAEFRPDSRLVALAGVEADIPEIPKEPSELALQMMKYMDCSCDWFAPMADATPLDQAWVAALEAGPAEGFVPVLVKVDGLLMDRLMADRNGTGRGKASLEEIRAYRCRLSEKEVLPDAAAYLRSLFLERKQMPAEQRTDVKEAVDDKPNNDLTAYWNFQTRLTDEMLLVRIPVDAPWKIFSWLPRGGAGNIPDDSCLMAIAKYWYEIYGAVPAVITADELEFYLPAPVEDESEALLLAREHYAFCPFATDLGYSDEIIGRRAKSILQATVWYFSWY